LIKAGHSVTVYDSLVTGHRAAVPAEAHFIHASLDDSHALAEALTSKNYDAVMHFAAFIEAGESMKDPGKFFRNNFHQLAAIDGDGCKSRGEEDGLFLHGGGISIERGADH
jgi:UDP-glucose 4-epimerase